MSNAANQMFIALNKKTEKVHKMMELRGFKKSKYDVCTCVMDNGEIGYTVETDNIIDYITMMYNMGQGRTDVKKHCTGNYIKERNL